MDITDIILSRFRLQELKKDDGTFSTPAEVLKDNAISCLEAFEKMHSSSIPEDCLLLAVREKIDDTDYQYSISCLPIKKYNDSILNLLIHGFKSLPTIIFNNKRDILETIRRVLKNKAFM